MQILLQPIQPRRSFVLCQILLGLSLWTIGSRILGSWHDYVAASKAHAMAESLQYASLADEAASITESPTILSALSWDLRHTLDRALSASLAAAPSFQASILTSDCKPLTSQTSLPEIGQNPCDLGEFPQVITMKEAVVFRTKFGRSAGETYTLYLTDSPIERPQIPEILAPPFNQGPTLGRLYSSLGLLIAIFGLFLGALAIANHIRKKFSNLSESLKTQMENNKASIACLKQLVNEAEAQKAKALERLGWLEKKVSMLNCKDTLTQLTYRRLLHLKEHLTMLSSQVEDQQDILYSTLSQPYKAMSEVLTNWSVGLSQQTPRKFLRCLSERPGYHTDSQLEDDLETLFLESKDILTRLTSMKEANHALTGGLAKLNQDLAHLSLLSTEGESSNIDEQIRRTSRTFQQDWNPSVRFQLSGLSKGLAPRSVPEPAATAALLHLFRAMAGTENSGTCTVSSKASNSQFIYLFSWKCDRGEPMTEAFEHELSCANQILQPYGAKIIKILGSPLEVNLALRLTNELSSPSLRDYPADFHQRV